jgi:hypothetical protein
MAHDVFISYSSKDKKVADAVCATLEERKVRCWIAPRDVPPGLPYAAALVKAINECKVFVLVLSKGSNTSGQVLREVEQAVDGGIPIIPVRIEDIEPTDAMRYYIKSLHWLDAMNPPLERHLGKLADSVQAILAVGAEEQLPPLAETTIETMDTKQWPLPIWSTVLLMIGAMAVIAGIVIVAMSSSDSTKDSVTDGGDVVDQALSLSISEEYDCELDTGSQVNFYAMESRYSSHPIEIDGEINSFEEWSDATCVDLRMHFGFNISSSIYKHIRWWVKNSNEEISFLIRIPDELAVKGVYVDYFWPEYTGIWEHSDGVYITIDGELFDHGNWDETRWYEDEELDPPGTIDLQGVVSEDSGFYWFEIVRPLTTEDGYDWDLEPGQTVGNNPYDSFLIGIVLEEGEFMRYLRLNLGEP